MATKLLAVLFSTVYRQNDNYSITLDNAKTQLTVKTKDHHPPTGPIFNAGLATIKHKQKKFIFEEGF